MGNRNALASSGVHRRPGSVARGVADLLHPHGGWTVFLKALGPGCQVYIDIHKWH